MGRDPRAYLWDAREAAKAIGSFSSDRTLPDSRKRSSNSGKRSIGRAQEPSNVQRSVKHAQHIDTLFACQIGNPLVPV
jgi:hypothetical protein